MMTNATETEAIEILVRQKTFHGWADVPIRGRNWRGWNEMNVAVDMSPEDVKRMSDAASCTVAPDTMAQ